MRLGFTDQVLVELEANAKFPAMELLPVALRFKGPLTVNPEEIFKAPVSVAPTTAQLLAKLAPETVRLPVPAFAVKEETPYQTPLLPTEALMVMAPLVALVFKLRFPAWAPLYPKSPVSVMFPAVMVVSFTSLEENNFKHFLQA